MLVDPDDHHHAELDVDIVEHDDDHVIDDDDVAQDSPPRIDDSEEQGPTAVAPRGSEEGTKKPKKPKKPKTQKQSSKKQTKPTPSTGTGGVPTPSNPTFSFSLPGPAPLGVPNFFIDSFQIPPFLLPIYQAAGIEYDVPWQVLAAINEIETDYGRNLSVSSAGAVGWMQFLPSTWKEWGVDANGDGVADPYNPVDAIFTAARYLHAAGASKNLSQAIFAYNHAGWYVQSVLLRAKLIGGMPDKLIGALTGLVEGHFPVAAPAKYADSNVDKLAKEHIKSGQRRRGDRLRARRHGRLDLRQAGLAGDRGQRRQDRADRSDPQLGRYIELQDSTGNIYTYAHLGTIPSKYPVPKPVKLTAKEIAKELPPRRPTAEAAVAGSSAGTQQTHRRPRRTSKATKTLKSSSPADACSVSPAPREPARPSRSPPRMVKERLFADPSRPASYAAGGSQQLKNSAARSRTSATTSRTSLHLGKNQYTLKPLKAGAIVVAGTILGRIAAPSKTTASHLVFMIRRRARTRR